jgi:hypothetical protein
MNKKGSVTELVEISTRIKYESQSWTGYNPGLVQDLDESVHALEQNQAQLRSQVAKLSAEWLHNIVVVGVGVVAFGLFITLWVAMGTSWRDAKKAAEQGINKELIKDEKGYEKRLQNEYNAKYNELRAALEREDFEKLGYIKETVLGKTVWVKR